jgi:hemolysin activation/secretion protein
LSFRISGRIPVQAFCILAALLCLAAFPAGARAQSADVINRANQQSERIQREQQQRQQEDIQRSEGNRPQTTLVAPTPAVPKGHGAGCRVINRIVLRDTVHMSYAAGGEAVQPYVGKCLGVDEIEAILSALTKFYVDKGYATTRVYLPPQDLSQGTLLIAVVPGKVSALELDKDAKNISHLGNVFPGVVGEDLNLRDFEQGIDNLNRLSSNNASIDLQPGAAAGESVVVVRNEAGKRWHVNASVDNYGPRLTGRSQLGLTGSFDNLTGFNDFISFTKNRTFPLDDDDKQSNSGNLLFSIPFGYAMFTAGYLKSDYDSAIVTPGGASLHLSGDSRTYYGTAEYTFFRDQFGKASAHATLTNGETNSYLAHQKLSVSSRTLTVLQGGVSFSRPLLGGSFNAGADIARGLHILNALDDPDNLPKDAPRAQFTKYTLSAGYSHGFVAQGQNLSFSTQFSGQYSPDVLYGSEQFSVGGIYTVRGFYSEELANDNGFYIRNDLSLIRDLGSLRGLPVTIRPYVAFDIGAVGSHVDKSPSGALGGAAVGFGLNAGPVALDVYTGHPVFYPHEVENEKFNTFARLSVSF